MLLKNCPVTVSSCHRVILREMVIFSEQYLTLLSLKQTTPLMRAVASSRIEEIPCSSHRFDRTDEVILCPDLLQLVLLLVEQPSLQTFWLRML